MDMTAATTVEKVCVACEQSYTRTSNRQKFCGKCGKATRISLQRIPRRLAIRSRGRQRQLAKFGITLIEYENLLKKQLGCCAICKQPERRLDNSASGKIKSLALDHHHLTGKLRGLICQDCNLAVGLLKDDPKLVKSLLYYLLAWEQNGSY